MADTDSYISKVAARGVRGEARDNGVEADKKKSGRKRGRSETIRGGSWFGSEGPPGAGVPRQNRKKEVEAAIKVEGHTKGGSRRQYSGGSRGA